LQEINDTQSVASSHQINMDLICKEEESVQTDEYLFPIHASEAKRINAKNAPFDYAKLQKESAKQLENSDSDDEQEMPRKPPTARSMMAAKNEKEIIESFHARSKHEMNTLQHRYELRITELLENHMNEMQETKKATTLMTIKKLERILILELEKMCQAIMCKSRDEAQENNKSANMIISDLIVDLTSDNSTYENLEKIKKKLNEVLIKYKQKVDFKTKHKLEQDLMNEKKKLRDEYQKMREEFEYKPDSPSILDTGIEHESPEKRIRPSSQTQQFADFTKEYRLCDKKAYDQNIITKVCPAEMDKTIVVDLQRIVTDLNMVKNTFAASSKQLGFNLIEPHKIEAEEYQEQQNPNIPEPVYTTSQKYRHLLNTFLRFSRDLLVNINGDEDVRCFKEDKQKLENEKQEIMTYKLKISDLKDKVKTLDKEQKFLQSIYQNHLDSTLQIIDFNDYETNKFTDFTQD
jgi:hypothetical protein